MEILVVALSFVACVAATTFLVRGMLGRHRPDPERLSMALKAPERGAQLPTDSVDIKGTLRRDPVFDVQTDAQRWWTPGA